MQSEVKAEAHTAAAPNLGDGDVCAMMQERWGLDVQARCLTSERDQNFLVTATDGRGFIVKIANPSEDRAVSNLQTAALQRIQDNDPGLPVPHLLPALTGAVEVDVTLPDGREAMVRVLSCVGGSPLYGMTVTPAMAHDLGGKAARLDQALAGMRHPAERHPLVWDMTQIDGLAHLLVHQDGEDGDLVRREFHRFCTDTLPRFDGLRWQLIHNDLNLYNVFGDGDQITGLIDFGDMVRAPLALDPAIAAAYLMVEGDDPFTLARAFLAAYQQQLPLTEQEIALLPDIMIGRHLLTLLVTRWRAELHPDNATYILRNEPHALTSLRHLVRARADGTVLIEQG
ncbi:phosphotransferase [Ruegeria sp.]|uniref:phosphotransferase n=1 Tax=Ruegeria sp. TaxID=1879320 RepID=UPI002326CDB0|nr:phosphotransferase [Ruegeria sp.]MDA7966500.1 phosphotransferase [Ruegeria sp.]